MTHQPADDLHHSPPLPQMRSELVKENKNDEHASVAASVENRHEEDNAGSAMPMQKIYQRLNTTPEQIALFCEKWQLTELALFGSALREDFRIDGEKSSDIDVLFTYGENSRKNLILQARMKFELEDLFHRTVDLVSKTAILADPNYIRRQHILGSARIIYVER